MKLCIDYRELNKLTIKNKYPLPRKDDLFDKLKGAWCISLKLIYDPEYHQLNIKPDRIYPRQHSEVDMDTYKFLVMAFGLTNASSHFHGLD